MNSIISWIIWATAIYKLWIYDDSFVLSWFGMAVITVVSHEHRGISTLLFSRVDSRFAPSQWETALLCNTVSHWLGARLESALPVTQLLLGNLTVSSAACWWFPSQRASHAKDLMFSLLYMNKLLNKQISHWLFETPQTLYDVNIICEK